MKPDLEISADGTSLSLWMLSRPLTSWPLATVRLHPAQKEAWRYLLTMCEPKEGETSIDKEAREIAWEPIIAGFKWRLEVNDCFPIDRIDFVEGPQGYRVVCRISCLAVPLAFSDLIETHA